MAKPNLGLGVAGSSINAISGLSNESIWLAGYTEETDTEYTSPLLLHWDGGRMRRFAAPSTEWPWSNLYDVAVIAEDDVWAVGSDYMDILLLHWDGSNWSRVPAPATATSTGELTALAPVTSNDVWAVGCCDGLGKLLLAHWDGESWSLTPPPVIPGHRFVLHDVDAIASDDIWAVGAYGLDTERAYNSRIHGNGANTLAIHWNGKKWEQAPSPNLCHGTNTLQSVTAISSNDIWAVGNCTDDSFDEYSSPRLTLIEHWDGTKWSIIESPNPSATQRHELTGISAINSDDIYSVGLHASSTEGYFDRALVLHWDGQSWSSIPSPTFSKRQDFTDTVAVTKDEIWAVGSTAYSELLATRILRSPCPTP